MKETIVGKIMDLLIDWLSGALLLAETEADFIAVFERLDTYLEQLELPEEELNIVYEIAGYV